MPVHTGVSLGKLLLPALGIDIRRCTGATISMPVDGVAIVSASFVADGVIDAERITKRFRVVEIEGDDDEG